MVAAKNQTCVEKQTHIKTAHKAATHYVTKPTTAKVSVDLNVNVHSDQPAVTQPNTTPAASSAPVTAADTTGQFLANFDSVVTKVQTASTTLAATVDPRCDIAKFKTSAEQSRGFLKGSVVATTPVCDDVKDHVVITMGPVSPTSGQVARDVHTAQQVIKSDSALRTITGAIGDIATAKMHIDVGTGAKDYGQAADKGLLQTKINESTTLNNNSTSAGASTTVSQTQSGASNGAITQNGASNTNSTTQVGSTVNQTTGPVTQNGGAVTQNGGGAVVGAITNDNKSAGGASSSTSTGGSNTNSLTAVSSSQGDNVSGDKLAPGATKNVAAGNGQIVTGNNNDVGGQYSNVQGHGTYANGTNSAVAGNAGGNDNSNQNNNQSNQNNNQSNQNNNQSNQNNNQSNQNNNQSQTADAGSVIGSGAATHDVNHDNGNASGTGAVAGTGNSTTPTVDSNHDNNHDNNSSTNQGATVDSNLSHDNNSSTNQGATVNSNLSHDNDHDNGNASGTGTVAGSGTGGTVDSNHDNNHDNPVQNTGSGGQTVGDGASSGSFGDTAGGGANNASNQGSGGKAGTNNNNSGPISFLDHLAPSITLNAAGKIVTKPAGTDLAKTEAYAMVRPAADYSHVSVAHFAVG